VTPNGQNKKTKKMYFCMCICYNSKSYISVKSNFNYVYISS